MSKTIRLLLMFLLSFAMKDLNVFIVCLASFIFGSAMGWNSKVPYILLFPGLMLVARLSAHICSRGDQIRQRALAQLREGREEAKKHAGGAVPG